MLNTDSTGNCFGCTAKYSGLTLSLQGCPLAHRFPVAPGGAGEPSSELFTRVAVLWVVVRKTWIELACSIRVAHVVGRSRVSASCCLCSLGSSLDLRRVFHTTSFAGTGGGLARHPPAFLGGGLKSDTLVPDLWGRNFRLRVCVALVLLVTLLSTLAIAIRTRKQW